MLLVGRRHGIEERLVPQAGLKLATLDIRGLDFDDLRATAAALARLPGALLQARRLLADFAPDVVVGAAGYVCAPVVVAARTGRSRPVVLLEQNRRPGRAVRLLARFADAVCVSFPDTGHWLRHQHVVHTGNPLRAEVLAATPQPLGQRCRRVLVMGGSQGARRINDAVVGAVRRLLEGDEELTLTHACGERDAPWVLPVQAALPEPVRRRYTVAPFFDDIAERIAAADLVVMRAGGSSLAEVSALGRPMILVPYPFANRHQHDNAAFYREAGAAVVVADEELSAARLRGEVEALVADVSRWRAMAAASAATGRRQATDEVLRVLREVAA